LARGGVGRDDRAGVVLGAVDAVGVTGEGVDPAAPSSAIASASRNRRFGRRGRCRARSRWSRRRQDRRGRFDRPAPGLDIECQGACAAATCATALDRVAEHERRRAVFLCVSAAAAVSDSLGLAMIVKRAPASRASPGFGVSQAGSARRWAIAGDGVMPYFASTARAPSSSSDPPRRPRGDRRRIVAGHVGDRE
jgi:hypothetical protein